MRVLVCTLALAGLLFVPAAISAQDQPASTTTPGVAMIAHSTQAIDYRRGDHTDVDLTSRECREVPFQFTGSGKRTQSPRTIRPGDASKTVV